MHEIKGQHLIVPLPAAEVRRRLKGYGFGVRKVHSAGRGQALIIHTATGDHLRELESLFRDALPLPPQSEPDAEERRSTTESLARPSATTKGKETLYDGSPKPSTVRTTEDGLGGPSYGMGPS